MRSFQFLLPAGVAMSLLAAGPALGQTLEPGFHLGLAATTFSGDANTEFNFRSGFSAGVSLGITFPSGLAIQPEVRYALKGATSDSATIADVEQPLDVKSTISYLEVPVLVVYRFDTGGGIRPKVFAGPFLAWKLDSTIEWGLASGGTRMKETDSSVQSRDVGFVVGAGLEFDFAGERLVFGARATLGRSDIRDRPDAPLRNTGIELFTGLTLQ